MRRLYRFGDFTFEPASGDLSVGGRQSRLQPQVAVLLAMLVEQPGAVITRAELQARIWPDTTVEFDDGLNFCIRQLRVALGDDANAPRFIETLPKRGYRFLPAVSIEPDAAAGARAPRARRRGAIAGTAALFVAIALLARAHRLPWQEPPVKRVVIAMLGFTADTTDPMMVGYRRRVMNRILTDARAEHGWEVVTDSSAAVTHYFSGALAKQGNSVKIFAHVVAAGDGRHVWADDLVDSYAFDGNSTVMAGRIEKSVARALGVVQ
jgi:DNA-binding winged helix-turn-helix (wHTH) protein